MLISERRTKLVLIQDIGGWLAGQEAEREQSKLVRRVQRGLAKLSYPVDTVDGILGDRTRTAVKEFQSARGLPATGSIDEDLASTIETVEKEGLQTVFLDTITVDSSGELGGLLAKAGEQCDVLSDSELCIATDRRATVRTRGQDIQEQYCAASGHAHEAQADIYVFFGSTADYVCSRRQSCAFLQYENPEAFAAACVQER